MAAPHYHGSRTRLTPRRWARLTSKADASQLCLYGGAGGMYDHSRVEPERQCVPWTLQCVGTSGLRP